MAIAFASELVDSFSASAVAGTGSVTVSGATSGRLLVAVLTIDGTAGGTPTDDTGNWTIRNNDSTTSSVVLERIASGTSSDNFQVSWVSLRTWALTIAEYSGNAASPYLSSSFESFGVNGIVAQTTQAIPSAGAITPSTSPGMAVLTISNSDLRDYSTGEISDNDGLFTESSFSTDTNSRGACSFIFSYRFTTTAGIQPDVVNTPVQNYGGSFGVLLYEEAAAGGTWPHGPLGHPLHGTFGGPI